MESGSRRSASTRGAPSSASIRTVCSGCLLRWGSQSSARPERQPSMVALSMPTGSGRARPAPRGALPRVLRAARLGHAQASREVAREDGVWRARHGPCRAPRRYASVAGSRTRRSPESRRARQRAATRRDDRRPLLAFAPDAIYGLPSALLEVASVLRDRGQTLAIARVFTSGELLRPAVREAIADAFQARVFDIYGSSETKEIAWECPEGAIHVNADVIHLEVLDDDGRPCPSVSRATSLRRRS